MAATGEQIVLRHAGQRAVVVEAGGGLRTYQADGRELLDGYPEQEFATAARGQILIPWPNRLRDGAYEFDGQRHQLPLDEPERSNAIHGLVRWANWRIAERDGDRVRLEYALHPREGFPFALALALEYRLDDDGLTVRTSATNVGTRPCPYGAGAHPYVTVGTDTIDRCTLRAPGSAWMVTDSRLIPTRTEPVAGTDYDFRCERELGATSLDTAFAELERDRRGRARVQLAAPGAGPRVTVWQDAGYKYVMLFTGDALAEPGRRRRGLGVEPMTCAPNAFQTGQGLITLQPGEGRRDSWGIAPG